MQKFMDASPTTADRPLVIFKLLVLAVDGYVFRSDIIERRFLTCQLAQEVVDFSVLGKKVTAFQSNFDDLLDDAFCQAVGTIILKNPSESELLDADIEARLSFPWIVDTPLPKMRLALVHGKDYPHPSTGQLGVYKAAKALGIELAVLDRDGHWAQDDNVASKWRSKFLVCDLTLNDGLPDRIVNALSRAKKPVDAITTYTNRFLPFVARAAEKLGLYTNPADAFDIANDKFRTRGLMYDANLQVFSVKSTDELTKLLPSLPNLTYPLIVKLTAGVSSEGVTNVDSEAELLEAVCVNQHNFPGAAALIEPYINGPKVNANFILMDCELLFSEVNDDFPSYTDKREDGHPFYSPPEHMKPCFAELTTVIPSALPPPRARADQG